ncbi:hypothetical protein EYF80_012812 [Liparis tanakae]|uniref:Uncharacterized protein n=1 Tax=Liparis tanakae TaxID=230148 RepID=A0A4Z2IG44_9TELE|nr:hypothetical protein EYF80_012812 [Liparis tanakae]
MRPHSGAVEQSESLGEACLSGARGGGGWMTGLSPAVPDRMALTERFRGLIPRTVLLQPGKSLGVSAEVPPPLSPCLPMSPRSHRATEKKETKRESIIPASTSLESKGRALSRQQTTVGWESIQQEDQPVGCKEAEVETKSAWKSGSGRTRPRRQQHCGSQSLDEWEFVWFLVADGERLLCAHDRDPSETARAHSSGGGGLWPCEVVLSACVIWLRLCLSRGEPAVRFVGLVCAVGRSPSLSLRTDSHSIPDPISDASSEKFFSTAAVKGIMVVPLREWTFLCNGGELPCRGGGRLGDQGYDPFRAVAGTGSIDDERSFNTPAASS